MGISPTYKTSIPTAPLWTIQLVPDSGIFNVSGLTVSDFQLLMHNLDTGVETTGAGTFSNIQAAVTQTINGATVIISPASVQYQVASADVTVGKYRLFVLVTVANGVEAFLFEEDWQVVLL